MIKKLLSSILRSFGDKRQHIIFEFLSKIPILSRIEVLSHRRWVRRHYSSFGREQRNEIFLSIARFAHINRPIEGYYMEFGCHEGNTMRLAWDNFRYLFDWHYVAFDSFEGLPDMEDFDRSDIFIPGNLKTSEKHFRDVMLKHGIPNNRLTTVKGFYDDTLTHDLSEKLKSRNAAVIYVDCDLYKSTVPVLHFIRNFLQIGTVIVFDDWNCYHARNDRGERKAWEEFCAQNPTLSFVEFVSTAEGQAFICTSIE